MTNPKSNGVRTGPTLIAVVGLLTCLSVAAADHSGNADTKRRYQRESAACMKMRVDDRSDCLSEASTRRAATLPSRAEEARDILTRNALKRCEPLSEPDRSDCVSRTQGQGTTSGSVAAGGIYRELVTREVGVVAVTPAPAASTATIPPK